MRTNPIDPNATRKLTAALVATLQRAATDGTVLRDAVVAALAQALAPEDFQELVAELAEQQRAMCETERRAHIAAAIAGRTDGRLDSARQAAEAAVRLDFAIAESHRVLAEILEQAGDMAVARTEYLLAMHLGWDGAEADAAIARTEPGAAESEEGTSLPEGR